LQLRPIFAKRLECVRLAAAFGVEGRSVSLKAEQAPRSPNASRGRGGDGFVPASCQAKLNVGTAVPTPFFIARFLLSTYFATAMNSIPEHDWKVFKRIHEAAVKRFCSRVLDEVRQLVSNPDTDPHEQYLKLYKLIEQRDEQIANAFNDYRRSTAFWQIVKMQNLGVLTDQEFAQFGEQTRNSLTDLRRIAEG
jgi:hypothetical protein